jgi:hypothetical protein
MLPSKISSLALISSRLKGFRGRASEEATPRREISARIHLGKLSKKFPEDMRAWQLFAPLRMLVHNCQVYGAKSNAN